VSPVGGLWLECYDENDLCYAGLQVHNGKENGSRMRNEIYDDGKWSLSLDRRIYVTSKLIIPHIIHSDDTL